MEEENALTALREIEIESDERSRSVEAFTKTLNMKKDYFRLHQPDYGPT